MKTLFQYFSLLLLPGLATPSSGTPTQVRMPLAGDYTSMWWKDGFPSHVEGAEWIRCIRTGHYAMAMNTETLAIPHLGAVAPGSSYAASNWLGTDWSQIPSAKLGLTITRNGKTYRCTKGGKWSRFEGPRLIVSGRYLQRADITGLQFAAEDGAMLNAETRLEMVAWPEKLGWVLSARPGREMIPAGEESFGRVGGGFGFDGSNHLPIPHRPELEHENFTLEFWAFIPPDHQAHSRSPAWMVCKNHHEQFDGNYGILLTNGQPQAQLNIGGGREGANTAAPKGRNPLRLDAWNHLAMSYDSETLRLYVNGQVAGETQIGKKRKRGKFPLVFGRRLARGNLYSFRGVLDEIRLYDRALTLQEIRWRSGRPEVPRPSLKPVAEWLFRKEGKASMQRTRDNWERVGLGIELTSGEKTLQKQSAPSGDSSSKSGNWHQVALWMAPRSFQDSPVRSQIRIDATELPSGKPRPVALDATLGAFRVNLDKVQPITPQGATSPGNDVMERVKIVLQNPSEQSQTVPLIFEKTRTGFRHRLGVPITGVTAVLRDKAGNPTGIPVQLSKNWHNDARGGTYASQWFHGVAQVRLPAKTSQELELVLTFGHWGGIPAVTHSQLSLIGWGGNQLWEQAAYGAWGESICFDPDQTQAAASITDVRPLMVRSMGNAEKWGWTVNVGGGDFLRYFDKAGKRIPHSSMKTTYQRQGPCLTEVTHSGKIGSGIRHWSTVSLARNDDLTRGIYRFRMEVTEPVEFSRLVLFQVGSDTYNYSAERKFATGNETGLLQEWKTQWGGNTYRTEPAPWKGKLPWASLHDAVRDPGQSKGAWPNRGLILRDWTAQLGGKTVQPWYAERGLERHRKLSSTFDLLPPPGVTRLEPGDFVEAVIEHLVIPQSSDDYYGPNQALREALSKHGNTWHMVHREAVHNAPEVKMLTGTLFYRHPGLWIQTQNGTSRFEIKGGTSYIPITFLGLTSPNSSQLLINGQPFDQSVHGKDFWQTDYDPTNQTWSRTYNIPPSETKVIVELKPPTD